MERAEKGERIEDIMSSAREKATEVLPSQRERESGFLLNPTVIIG